MATVFFSYSHRDEDLRNEVETALAPLKRQGLIDVWHDRRITAGSDFGSEIDERLEAADIILLLVSNYFIDSDYAYGIELARAMERHNQGEARVIPIILRPSDWHSLSFGKLLALPPDGKPITSYPDIHEALTEVSKGLRAVLSEIKLTVNTGSSEHVSRQIEKHEDGTFPNPPRESSGPRSSNLRIPKTFTDQEKDQFLDKAFEFIAIFFENSLAELKSRNRGLDVRYERRSANRFTATVYQDGNSVAECTIWRDNQHGFGNGVAYVQGRSDISNSYNELLSVDDDGYIQFLHPTMMFRGTDRETQMSNQGASEYLWGMLIGNLQR
ncbi:MAG: toll/interleukin-1 receptor domain-containing protein [Candidatus Thiodiazotropha sp. (ex Lucinoma borealis)]|nr:toll/interleukin-1 receptor domain-containing protein [Candidatus Thiodiazotropha sp. (ex Lucinoma borealis)]MCU7863200.1 toll/interleukin-1 receptor domain-containing protein [Candidatus Thiodiazotropha sp. (ex Lucinoma borealis)]